MKKIIIIILIRSKKRLNREIRILEKLYLLFNFSLLSITFILTIGSN